MNILFMCNAYNTYQSFILEPISILCKLFFNQSKTWDYVIFLELPYKCFQENIWNMFWVYLIENNITQASIDKLLLSTTNQPKHGLDRQLYIMLLILRLMCCLYLTICLRFVAQWGNVDNSTLFCNNRHYIWLAFPRCFDKY